MKEFRKGEVVHVPPGWKYRPGPTFVWVVGQHKLIDGVWEFIGVFSTEEKAVAACRDYTYFVGPARIDEQLPDETVEWTGSYYPISMEPE